MEQTIQEKKKYTVTLIDVNNVASEDTYNTRDIISLFMILAKELIHRDLEYEIKKIIIDVSTSSEV